MQKLTVPLLIIKWKVASTDRTTLFQSDGIVNRIWLRTAEHSLLLVQVNTHSRWSGCSTSSLMITGIFNCVGKQVANIELRLVLASVVRNYQFGFAPGERGEKVQGELRDTFTSSPGSFHLAFHRRDQQAVAS